MGDPGERRQRRSRRGGRGDHHRHRRRSRHVEHDGPALDPRWRRAAPHHRPRHRSPGPGSVAHRHGRGGHVRGCQHRRHHCHRRRRCGVRVAGGASPPGAPGQPRGQRASHCAVAGSRAGSQISLSKLPGSEITIGPVSPKPAGRAGAANGARVLVVDDEPNITELVAMALRYEGFSVKTAAPGRAALAAVSQFSPALVILDVMLPDIDGLEVLRRLNSTGHRVPIIFLTARDATEDKVHGLTVGGDDYVTKPFSVEELVARVRVVLRRHGAGGDESGHLQLADLELDDEAHEVRRAGKVVELTTTEYRLLRYLLVNAGRVLTRSQILAHVWHYDFGGDAAGTRSW